MEKEVTSTSEIAEAQNEWQTYLQKCCEVGQLDHALDQLDSQRAEIEKKIDITKRQAKEAARKHSEEQKALASKVQIPKPEETKEAH